MAMAAETEIETVVAEVMESGMEDTLVDMAGMGFIVGVKGSVPNTHTPKIDSGSSFISRPTKVEVVWYKSVTAV